MKTHFRIQLPDWINSYLAAKPTIIADIQEQMRLAIDLSQLNVSRKTGGPFGAALFDQQTGKLISVGVNTVVTGHCSLAHAETIAISLAQQLFKTHRLSAVGNFQLVTSCQPCAMCLGAIPWSGIKSLVCGARGSDAENLGFDEGAKPADWIEQLQKRHIQTHLDILRNEARAVLESYKADGGILY